MRPSWPRPRAKQALDLGPVPLRLPPPRPECPDRQPSNAGRPGLGVLEARPRTLVAVAATLAILLPLGWMWQSSLLPDSYDVAEMGYVDWGGGPVDEHHGMGHGTPVKDLIADPDRPADVQETLTVHVEDNHYTVNGTSPGPTVEATVGDLVEVTLVNDNVDDGITLHWHGVDVPNAEDGVAGVTQDAVLPGEQYVYRFVAEDAGTYWYHSHQISHEQVRRGLLGALVVHPEARTRTSRRSSPSCTGTPTGRR